MIFLDTNILLYRISNRPIDAAKRQIAVTLLERPDCALSVQVLNEFLHQSTRPTRTEPVAIPTAWTMVRSWHRFPVQELTLALLDEARRVQMRTLYTIWDSLVVAAAIAQGCATLYTEDMQDGRIIDGLRIVNPFRE